MGRGLTFRMVVAGGALVLVIGATFGLLFGTGHRLRVTAAQSDHARDEVVAASAVREAVADLQAGLRGYIITGQPSLLTPWIDARDSFPAKARTLQALAASNPAEARQVAQIVRDVDAYITDYATPVVRAIQRGDPSARSVAMTDAGQRRVDALSAEIGRLMIQERAQEQVRQATAASAARAASWSMTGGLAVSVLLVLGFTLYLSRVVVAPVRRVATMAGRLAAGALDTRLPVTGAGEVGGLQRSFNVMAGALEAGRAELTASRARIVAASDEARRHVERDLHDGAQQRLVALGLELRLAQLAQPPRAEDLQAELGRAADELTDVVEDLRQMAQGIHPAILSEGGLGPALRTLGRRSAVPVELDVTATGRFPDPVEAGAYYIVSEALTNAAKHARASAVDVRVEQREDQLWLTIRDDGCGGADETRGSGLVGLRDRAEALGGTLRVSSPPGDGTLITACLPGGRSETIGETG